MKNANIRNIKLEIMPILPTLCVCEKLDWTILENATYDGDDFD